ncbi:sporulation protein [Brevibacillus daliensis]|uniref:sporulation protein n=1 Tax=Brevibacillus daliensis TaxID=2892995 RepID=UPI001E370ED0|nr:sporulation protein [Brevibacillus daliensis]
MLIRKKIQTEVTGMFKKFLSRIGVGGATINLELDRSLIQMGEPVTGSIIVQGGEVEQEINEITVQFRVDSRYAHDERTYEVNEIVATMPPLEPFMIASKERKIFPFTMKIPDHIAISSLTTQYYFSTNLDIAEAIDAFDRDYIDVLPSGLMKNFHEGLKLLGCRIKAEAFTGKYQFFNFEPTTWLRGKLDELVFHLEPANSKTSISGHFEVDRKTSGIIGKMFDKMDLDEIKGFYRFTDAQLATPEKAAESIKNFVENIYNDLHH